MEKVKNMLTKNTISGNAPQGKTVQTAKLKMFDLLGKSISGLFAKTGYAPYFYGSKLLRSV
jgi:hypothetical protein